MLRSPGTAALILCLFLLAGCYPSAEETVVEGPLPIPKIVYLDSTIVVYPSVPWSDLVHTDLFEGFKPGMTFKDALSTVGPPNKAGKGLWGPYHEYRRPTGSVRISFETSESGTIGTKFSKWRLTAFPRSGSINGTLDPVLQERLSGDFPGQAEIVIMSPTGEHPTVNVTIKGKRIHSIEWLFEERLHSDHPAAIPLYAREVKSIPLEAPKRH